jgi:hypothetical protein
VGTARRHLRAFETCEEAERAAGDGGGLAEYGAA